MLPDLNNPDYYMYNGVDLRPFMNEQGIVVAYHPDLPFEWPERTVRWFGKGYGTQPVVIRATVNGEVVHEGAIDTTITESDTVLESDMSTVATDFSVLFTHDHTLSQIEERLFDVEITVLNGSFLKGRTEANWCCEDIDGIIDEADKFMNHTNFHDHMKPDVWEPVRDWLRRPGNPNLNVTLNDETVDFDAWLRESNVYMKAGDVLKYTLRIPMHFG
jgi:hypothetical protein